MRRGDALEVARGLAAESFRLVYLDPPFFTNRKQSRRDGGEGFSDRWAGGLSEYLEFLRTRLEVIRPLLTEEGSLLLHLDWRAVHYARVLCDDIFGHDRLRNEIIWSYRSGGGSKQRYGRKHDTILWYGKGKRPFFDTSAARVPYDAIIAPKRAHLFHKDGKVSGDVLEISRPPNHSREWTGWPTQKPIALLRFLVRVHSAPGDLVGDFFCGSGTALVAARELGRRAFGCDTSADALAIACKRLQTAKHNETPPPEQSQGQGPIESRDQACQD